MFGLINVDTEGRERQKGRGVGRWQRWSWDERDESEMKGFVWREK